mgnify:CR=1 FL=1|tara:strand:+ start:3960 stop:4298 length:339 start_codon:yes stop_codon:yes gene_type:complete
MKDDTTPLPGERKKIMFYESPDRQVRFRIRCQHDGVSQSQFFRLVLGGYINDDALIHEFLRNCKEKHGIQGKNKTDKIERMRKAAGNLKKKFSLEESEIESIYDIIEIEGDL